MRKESQGADGHFHKAILKFPKEDLAEA